MCSGFVENWYSGDFNVCKAKTTGRRARECFSVTIHLFNVMIIYLLFIYFAPFSQVRVVRQ